MDDFDAVAAEISVSRYPLSVSSLAGLVAAGGRVPCSPVMSFALLYSLICVLLDALLTRRQSELRLRAEVLALLHQLRVLERQVRRPRWQPVDRFLLTAFSRVLPRPAWYVDLGPGCHQPL